MKTGILTFHSAYNFGASLQAWALQTKLEELGVDAYMINYRPNIIDDLYNPMAHKRGIAKTRLYRKWYNSDQMLRYDNYEGFIKNQFHLMGEAYNYKELMEQRFDLDACIVGSDQVWNVEHTGGDDAYFLDFLNSGIRKISYAASIVSDYIMPENVKMFEKGLASFDAISVREKTAKGLLTDYTDKNIDVVLDPTLLLDVKQYDRIKKPVEYKEKYILVYMMERNKELISLARYMSRLMGLPIVQRRQNVIFKNELKPMYTYTAGEFLSCIEQAEFVLTNSFHGTVFSILYGKPFISMLHSDTGSRTIDLLSTLGLESHLMYKLNKEKCIQTLQFDNQDEVYQKIVEQRKNSINFLKNALQI